MQICVAVNFWSATRKFHTGAVVSSQAVSHLCRRMVLIYIQNGLILQGLLQRSQLHRDGLFITTCQPQQHTEPNRIKLGQHNSTETNGRPWGKGRKRNMQEGQTSNQQMLLQKYAWWWVVGRMEYQIFKSVGNRLRLVWPVHHKFSAGKQWTRFFCMISTCLCETAKRLTQVTPEVAVNLSVALLQQYSVHSLKTCYQCSDLPTHSLNGHELKIFYIVLLNAKKTGFKLWTWRKRRNMFYTSPFWNFICDIGWIWTKCRLHGNNFSQTFKKPYINFNSAKRKPSKQIQYWETPLQADKHSGS